MAAPSCCRYNRYHMDNVFAAFPEIETDRLLLREIMPEDTPAIYRIFSNDQVTRYHDLVTYTDPRQAEELIDFFDESFELERAIFWGITRQEDGALIGTCTLYLLPNLTHGGRPRKRLGQRPARGRTACRVCCRSGGGGRARRRARARRRRLRDQGRARGCA